MSYGLGIRLIRRLCDEQKPLVWQRAKLAPTMFKPNELPVFEFVEKFLKTHHVLPQPATLQEYFPDVVQYVVPEPVSYYLQQVENRYFYERINKANLDSQALLKEDENAHEKALDILKQCARDITEQKYRLRIMDFGVEANKALLMHYHHGLTTDELASIGWPYMDHMGGVYPGDVVSFVGRPAAGKTWKVVWSARHNWKRGQNTLLVSMEMMTLPIAQRLAAIEAGLPIHQLKTSGFSSESLNKFHKTMKSLATEKAKLYIVDGNLAASPDDIFLLAELLECKIVYIDGAYLLRNKNPRLDRYTRVAENVEAIKQYCTDLEMTTFCSWQFNRQASEKQKKGKGAETGVEDIGYTDVIGQISTIVMGLFQEESIETMKERQIRVLKGRNGEVGQFSIAWDFDTMDFRQVSPSVVTGDEQPKEEKGELQWL